MSTTVVLSHDGEDTSMEVVRLLVLLECEAGRAAPEGWVFSAARCQPHWTKGAFTIWRGTGGWYLAGVPAVAYPYALLAIEAERALVDLWPVTP